MRLEGGIYFNENGISQSTRAMHLQMEILNINAKNIAGFDKPGYQRKEPVVSSFSELIGVHGLSEGVDDQVGRIMKSGYPLDCSISKKGYFQLLEKDGSVKLTRDGRFTLNKDGELLGVEGQNVLDQGGNIIRLPFVPEELKDVKIGTNGEITVFNPETRKMEYGGTVSVVSTDGGVVLDPDIKQGYLEASNVFLEKEFFEMFPVRRNFEANRQMFLLQQSKLNHAIQQLCS